jgi:acetyl esterase/lipase
VWPVGDGQIGHGTIWFEMFVPYFSEAEFVPTRSELECPPDAFLTAELTGTSASCCRRARPGTTRRSTRSSRRRRRCALVAVPPVFMVASPGGTSSGRDRNKEYAARMREWGKDVVYTEVEGEQHVFFLLNALSESTDEVVRKSVVEHMDG